MNKQLSCLLKVQGINDRIADFRNNIEAINIQIKNRKNEIETDRKRIDESKEQIKSNKIEQDRRELDLKTNEEDLKKLMAQLNQAKSNEEYSVLNKRIEEEQLQNDGIEEEILNLMTRADELNSELEKVRAELAGYEKDIARESEEAGAEIGKHESRIRELQNESNAHEGEIDTDVLEMYHRVFERNKGSAMAVADEVALVCKGCNMSIPRQQINEILKDDIVVFCKSCNRILYIPDKFGEAG